LTLQPFGRQAGLASALLGFLQMSCAALATTASTLLPMSAAAAMTVVLAVYTGLAVVVFFLRPTGAASAAPAVPSQCSAKPVGTACLKSL
jgi:hypothetical protein